MVAQSYGFDAVRDAAVIFDTRGEEISFPVRLIWGRIGTAVVKHEFLLATDEVSTQGDLISDEGIIGKNVLNGVTDMSAWLAQLNAFRPVPLEGDELAALGAEMFRLANERNGEPS